MATSIAQKRHEVEVAPSIQAYDQLVSQDICDTVYTTRNTNFADVHNLDKCINHLNHSLATLGFSAGLDLLSTERVTSTRFDDVAVGDGGASSQGGITD